jgi:hypothetical protein
MESPQTSAQQREKSQSKAAYEHALDRVTGAHASMRLDSGFGLEHVVAEYRALRASVLWLWSETNPSNEGQHLDKVILFDETIDQAIAEVTRVPTGQRATAIVSSAFSRTMCATRCT